MLDLLTIIDLDHPLYSRTAHLLDPDLQDRLNKAPKPKYKPGPAVNFKALAKDYNELKAGEILAFLHFGYKRPDLYKSALTRRGLSIKYDCKVRLLPVLAVSSLNLLADAPTTEIPEAEFMSYACLAGEVYPDPVQHPNITAMDKAIPRRSNKVITSDTLPVLKHIWQVYFVKLSNKAMPEKVLK